ncbi:DNA cytosine methyltransferase [Streptomyces mirabilis]|uniref:DNA cytosine methyltransferase n=1 Tax=Streptomyces mirabilis TaxID=68239 RepID=UPI002259CB41|nr:DNA cytosine methyltransferase [Streptomyces mirabilis]MCX4608706.1 DNA cytosine methyltransferase [Streptomyces mirabilis]
MTLKVADFMAGGGGSSQGIHYVPGVELTLILNHWRLAIDSHALNFPWAQHECCDISQADFRWYPRVDILWSSPECVHHSVAQGKKRIQLDQIPDENGETLPADAAERSRATAWDIVRYLERMILRGKPVLGGVVENVIDFQKWVLFESWRKALEVLGYDTEIIHLNSAHAHSRKAPWAPQSRDRFYLGYVHRSVGRMPDWQKWVRPHATCPDHGAVRARQDFKCKDREPWGRYRTQYVYRCPVGACDQVIEPLALPASKAVDWTIPAQRIGDRPRTKAKPEGLSPKTMARIRDGLERYARHLVVPVEGREGKQAKPLDEPSRTMTTRRETGVAFIPFIAELRGGASKHRSTEDPLCTVTASGNHHGLVAEDLAVPYYGTGRARPLSQPLGALTTVDRYGLLKAQIQAEDCLFRMLEPEEIGTAMSFREGYKLLGTKRERVRMLGNAVTPNAAEVLVSALTEAITGEDLEPAVAP